ncbi:hypothetical protein KJY78_03405 [Canibacter sp. lx-45]|uniref:hypothetical protein n=1 Tax=Canibacter zhuwentaonis TaxID=2837491 RepID=UPI001BDDA400|nr:hypothetical protein [Canibacter zhuwentaonis]MBT1035397.1 hypothetical protein [Canibacter zhuwentaonis]
MNKINESVIEQLSLDHCREIGYRTEYAPDCATVGGVRAQYSDVVLWDKADATLQRLNLNASTQLISAAIKRIQRAEAQDAILENKRLLAKN